jgi:hypothetical protein
MSGQVGGRLAYLIDGGLRGCLIRVSDSHQISHGVPFSSGVLPAATDAASPALIPMPLVI